MQRVGAELQTQLADADQFETLAAEVDGLLSKAEEAANASQEKLAEPNATADSLGAAESALSSVDLSPLAEKLDELEKVAQNLPSDCQEKSASLRRRSASLSDNLGRLRQDAHQRAAALDDFDRKAADVRQQLDDMGAAAQTSRDKGPRDVDERAADLANVQVTTPSLPPSFRPPLSSIGHNTTVSGIANVDWLFDRASTGRAAVAGRVAASAGAPSRSRGRAAPAERRHQSRSRGMKSDL